MSKEKWNNNIENNNRKWNKWNNRRNNDNENMWK